MKSVAMKRGVVVALLVCSLPAMTLAFSMGAPDSACANMVPGHGVDSQKTPSPFSIQMNPWETSTGRRLLNVTLTGDGGADFAGFFLQARPSTGGNAVGSFEQDATTSKTFTCGSGLRNSVTHNNKKAKRRVDLIWEAPEDYNGVLIFNATFVKDYSTFWTGVRSEKFQVRPRSDNGPGLETSSRRPLTTTPTRKTTQASTTIKSSLPVIASGLSTSVHTGCGTLKGCFGYPKDCPSKQNCKVLVTYLLRGEIYEFELYSTEKAWVAAALSDDQDMALDSVMECAYQDGALSLHASWNEATKGGQHRLGDNPGLKLLNSSYADDEIYCRFTRDRITIIENVEFDLEKPYFLFIAGGDTFKENSVGYHGAERDYTGEKILLSDVSPAKAASKILVHLHGSFMIAAWIATASTGMLLARYFKQTWVGSQLCAKDQWFAWHRMLMVLTWCLTVAGFIIIFVELGAWSSAENPHAVLGVITTALAFIQPFMAALRPHPGTPRRPLFNWFHWLVGNLAHIFAIVTIFFAVLLARAELPEWMNWVLVAFVAFHVFMHLLFSISGCASDRAGSARVTAFPMKDMGASRNPLHGAPDRKQDAPYARLRKVLLAFYIIGVFGLAIALIVITVLAPIETTWKNVKSTVGFN